MTLITVISLIFGGVIASIKKLFDSNDLEYHNLKKITVNVKKGESTNDIKEETVVDMARGKNYSELIELSNTKSNIQKNQMINIELYLTLYNGPFANRDEFKNIKPHLKWDEVVSLKLAFNKYTEEDLREIFNGEKLDIKKLVNNYKSAINQLTKSFIAEKYNSPVSLDILVDSNKGRKLYGEVNRCFEAAKRSTGQERIYNINKFYKIIRENIESTNNYKYYNLVLNAMVKASEVVFENSKHDINKKSYNYVKKYYDMSEVVKILNKRYLKIQSVLDDSNVNTDIPLYKQFRNAKVKKVVSSSVKKEILELKNDDKLSDTVNYTKYVNVDNCNYSDREVSDKNIPVKEASYQYVYKR